MFIRSMILMAALGAAGAACVDTGTTGEATTESSLSTGGGFECTNGVGVGCIGTIAVIPINVDIKDIRVLNDAELSVLEDSLNDLSIDLKDVLNLNNILNITKVTVLSDLIDELDLDVDNNDVKVCASVLAGLLCK